MINAWFIYYKWLISYMIFEKPPLGKSWASNWCQLDMQLVVWFGLMMFFPVTLGWCIGELFGGANLTINQMRMYQIAKWRCKRLASYRWCGCDPVLVGEHPKQRGFKWSWGQGKYMEGSDSRWPLGNGFEVPACADDLYISILDPQLAYNNMGKKSPNHWYCTQKGSRHISMCTCLIK